MIADTGCQSCIMPTSVAISMGLSSADIFPVTLTMKGAINENLGVKGGLALDVTATDMSGSVCHTKQMVYLSDSINKAF